MVYFVTRNRTSRKNCSPFTSYLPVSSDNNYVCYECVITYRKSAWQPKFFECASCASGWNPLSKFLDPPLQCHTTLLHMALRMSQIVANHIMSLICTTFGFAAVLGFGKYFVGSTLVSIPDSLPKWEGEVWYSCIHIRRISEAWIWLVECYLIVLWHFTGGLVWRSAVIVIRLFL